MLRSKPPVVFSPSAKADNEAIVKYVMSDECQTIDDVKAKFTDQDTLHRALRIFDVCKNTDPNSKFASIQEKWNARDKMIVAFEYATGSDFASIAEAEQFLKIAKTKKVFGPKLGSAGSIEFEIDLDSIYRFILGCKDPNLIAPQFHLEKEITAARRMFTVCWANDKGCIFYSLRDKWTEEERAIVAKAHAKSELKCEEDITAAIAAGKSRSYSTFKHDIA